MQRMAVSWLVYTMTHSAFMLGLVSFAGQIPVLFLSPYAGAYVDRHSRYRTLLVTQIASMLQAGLLALIVLTGHYNIISIIALSILLGIINAFDTPSRQSLMIMLVQSRDDLPNAIALNSSMVTLARLLGPVAAGILLSSVGEGICFLINFLSFIAVITSLLLMKINIPARKKPEEDIWKNLWQGYTYLKGNLGLRSAILLMAVSSLLVMPYSTLFPVYAKTVFQGNVTTFSWLNSISGLGAMMGAIYMANLKPHRNLLKRIVLSALLLSVCLMLFAYSPHLLLALIFVMIGEGGMLAQIAATNTYVQTNVEEHMRGRVVSYYVMAFQGILPIGSLLIGLAAHITGAPLTVFIEGLAGVITVLLFIPTFKKAGRQATPKAIAA